MGDCLSHEGSLGQIGTTLKAVRRVSSSKNVQWDPGFWRVWCWRRLLSSFSNFKVSMAQETVEGGGGDRILGRERWLFTLHSDQSFLNTPELRDSRIGTHPAGWKHRKMSQKTGTLEVVPAAT